MSIRNSLSILSLLVSYMIAIWATVTWAEPISQQALIELLFYFIIFLFMKCQPVKIGNHQGTFSMVVLIPVFLKYGFVVEAWLYQIGSLIAFLLVYRYALMRIIYILSMYMWMSLIAAGSYFLLGGELRPLSFGTKELIPLFAYVIMSFLVNHLIIFLNRAFGNRDFSLFKWENIRWGIASTILSVPLGVLLYIVGEQTGYLGIFLVAIPILTISIIFKLYYEFHLTTHQLHSLHDVSMAFTAELNLEKTIESVITGIRNMVAYDYSIIYLVDRHDHSLYPYAWDPRSFQQVNKNDKIPIDFGLIGQAALNRNTRFIRSMREELIDLDGEPEYIRMCQSLLIVPIQTEDQLYGMILLGSQQESHFQKREKDLIEILARQAAIAIQNALRFEQFERRSLVDELTGLYNYREFNKRLNEVLEEAKRTHTPVSLLILDIDHFKKVNDTFGHLVGNEVLKKVAQTIKDSVRKNDIVARYGGEEFTIILPGATSKEAYEIAERMRKNIYRSRFEVKHSMSGNGGVYLTVTVSIGIASYPDLADDAISLIRHADRAMYVGSKQQGRNRVSLYQTGENPI